MIVSGGKLKDRERAAATLEAVIRSDKGTRQLLAERYKTSNPSFFVREMQAQERFLDQAVGAIERRFKVKISGRPRRSYDPTKIPSKASGAGLRRFGSRNGRLRRTLDPLIRRFGIGRAATFGKPHGYLGRHVLDLGDRHAHAIVDIPWDSLRVNLSKLKARFDPWTRALRGQRAKLLAVWNPRPSDPGDKAIIEAAVHVNRAAYNRLRQSGEFDVLSDGVLARRGRKKKATNIFVMPP